jgi:hypothetical protein
MKEAMFTALFFCYFRSKKMISDGLVAWPGDTVGRDYFFPHGKLPLKTAV